MNIDHNITKETTKRIKNEIGTLAAKATEINNKKGEIIKSKLLTDFAKAEKKKVLENEFSEYALSATNKIKQMFETIRDKEVENESAFDITDEILASALKITETMGNKLPWETMRNLVNGLKGYKQGLIVLKAAFEKYNISTKYINKHIIDAERKYDNIIEVVESIPKNVSSSLSNIYYVYVNMFDTAELLGISFTDEEKQANFDLESYQKSLAARVMGVNLANE